MKYRRFGRLGWETSEIGYGMWGIAGGEGGWSGLDGEDPMKCLRRAVDRGVNFFDTAWIYGRGHGERLLGRLLRECGSAANLTVATKIPPRNRAFPSKRGDRFEDIFPRDHMQAHLERSRESLGVECIDLIQFHVWEDSWAAEDEWQCAVEEWRDQGLVRGVGLSINRWEPWNCLDTLRTGLIDAVQVIYNVFDQAPEDELFGVCQALDIAVVARVPFDEGTLTGKLTSDSRWPEGDWRNSYFVPENLAASVARAEALRPLVPEGWSMPELALRFILHDSRVSTTIPGMRRLAHVEANTGVSDGVPFPEALLERLRDHRWDRQPTWWSQ